MLFILILGISRFPKDPELRELWINACRRPDWHPKQHDRICSDHFDKTDFDLTGCTVRLKARVIPRDQISKKQQESSYHNEKSEDPSVVLVSLFLLKYFLSTLIDTCLFQSETSSLECPQLPVTTNNTALIDHTYCVTESPRKLKRKLIQLRDENEQQGKKLKLAKRKCKRLRKRISSVKEVNKHLQNKLLISKDAFNILNDNFEGLELDFMKRILKNKKKKNPTEKYSPTLRLFALTLNFYSSKAYSYVRKSLGLALPHPSTLREWYSSVNGEPGFTTESFSALKAVTEANKEKGKTIICSLMFDSMSIKKKIEYDGKKYHGYVDMGTGIESDVMPDCTEVLVFMVVAVNDSWKIPIGYFFINGLNGTELANIVKLALIKLHDVGVKIVSLTCDGPPAHFSMLTTLGASLKIGSAQPWILHPTSKERIHCILDFCHVLKLIRNAWEHLKVIYNDKGQAIKYRYNSYRHK